MAIDTSTETPAIAAALTEYATIRPITDPNGQAQQPLKRKRAITPSGTTGDLEKQALSFDERPLEEPLLKQHDGKEQGTFLYLAYGSNLAQKTFQGMRGIKPLRAVNVHVPDLELTFDLPGFAYAEPCFANTRWRKVDDKGAVETSGAYRDPHQQSNLGWSKGLVGVVYEVTAADYKHIIETEGGGAGYKDIQIPCYLLPGGTDEVPDPDGYPQSPSLSPGIPEKNSKIPFLAHTLLAASPSGPSHSVRKTGWAQPSARYLRLIRAGSHEHQLPAEYCQWLDDLQPYQATHVSQKIGGMAFQAFWGPLLLALVKLGPLVSNEKGIMPQWYATLVNTCFAAAWWSYDRLFFPLAGEGERTEGT